MRSRAGTTTTAAGRRRVQAGRCLPVLLGAVLVPAVLLPSAAQAAPRTLRGAYTTGVAVPDPTTGGTPHETCDGLAASRSRHAVRLPGAGVLRVVLTSSGDWGLAVRDSRGRALGRADSEVLGPERLAVRLPEAGRVLLDACNFAGAPTARVSWTFTRTA